MKETKKTPSAFLWALVVAFLLVAAAAFIAKSVDYERPAIKEMGETNWDELYYGESHHAPSKKRDAGVGEDGGTAGVDGGTAGVDAETKGEQEL